MRVLVAAAVTLFLLASIPAPAEGPDPVHPDEIEGLVARYTVDSLHGRLRDGEKVDAWPDASGNGHDLTDDRNGVSALFRTVSLNGKPVVEVLRQNSYSVHEPFELGDHTVFLVYATDAVNSALLRSDRDERAGFVLNKDGVEHQYQNGKDDLRIGYSVPSELPEGFSVTVLGRDKGVVHAFVNGVDRSASTGFADPVRVGKFFKLEHSRGRGSDGNGLLVAEMIFYDRFLSDEDRGGLTAHLADRYGIRLEERPDAPEVAPVPELSEVQAWLETDTGVDLNRPEVVLEWNRHVKLDPPFRHSLEEDGSKLICTRKKRTDVRLFVKLQMKTAEPGAVVRVLILKNREAYEPVEGLAEHFEGPPGALTVTVQFALTVSLEEADFIEVVTWIDGAEGRVSLVPGQAILAARAL